MQRYSRPTVYAYVPNFVSIGLFCRPLAAKTPKFCRFFNSAFYDVASWQQSEKVEHGCTTKNLPLSKVSKSFLYSNAFMAKSGAQTLTSTSVTERQTNQQTNRQKTQRFWNLSPTKLGTVIEDAEHVLAPLKCWGPMHSFVARGR